MNEKAKELILKNNAPFLLNKIYTEIAKYEISDEEVENAIGELARTGLIKIQDLRGELWQMKIIPLTSETDKI